MITADVICLLFLAILIGVGAICLLAYGIYSALIEHEMYICVAMIVIFLCLSALSGLVFNESYKEYKNAIPQNQIKILRQKISDAEKELQKYLIEHPELKESKEMSRKELKDQLEVFENYINDIPNVIDPCSQCEFKDRSIWDNLEKCKECCYYYSSNFKIETGKTKL
jgi:hypothetical protein